VEFCGELKKGKLLPATSLFISPFHHPEQHRL